MKTLIRNVIVKNNKVDILIEGNKISSIGTNLSNNVDRVIDGNGAYVLPGACNCFFDGNIDDCSNLASQGVTTVFDFSNNIAITKKLVEQGLKVFSAVGDFNGEQLVDENFLDLEVKKRIDVGVIAPIIYLSAQNISDENQHAEAIKYGKKHNYLIATSVSEFLEDVGKIDNEYGMSPISLLESYGFFDYKCLLIDCVYADKDDVNIIANYDNVSVCTCPTKNLVNGSGIAPIYSLKKNNINIVLGGNCSNIFAELALTKNLQSGSLNEKNILMSEDVEPLISNNVKKIFAQVGALNVGDYADILITNSSNIDKITPLNIIMTLVNGNIVYKK